MAVAPVHSAAAAIAAALAAAPADPRDASAVELAQRYALLIDNAVHSAKYRTAIRDVNRALNMLAETEPLSAALGREALAKLTDALSAHSVASDLGPKLLAALTALGLTPAARGVTATAKGGASGAPTAESERTESEFERLRRERRERNERAGMHGA